MKLEIYDTNIEPLLKIDKRLRRFNLKSKLELLRILYHATDLDIPNDDFLLILLPNNVYRKRLRGKIYKHELAYLTLASIISEEWNGPTSDIQYSDLRNLIILYRKFNIPFKHKDDTNLSDEEIITQFSVRTGLQQFIFQRYAFKGFYRYNYFFNYASSELNIKQKFIESFKYKYEDYLLFTWFLYIYSSQTLEFNKDKLIERAVEILMFPSEKIEGMLNTFMISREGFIEQYKKFASIDANMKVYDFNPIIMKPILNDKVVDALFPMPFSIFIAVTEGLYQQLCTIHGLKFKSAFGKNAFEDYIEHIFKLHNYVYIKEFEYRFQKNNLRSPDIILVKEDHIIFIELKARVPSITLRTTNYKQYNKELEMSFGAALAQCFKKEKHLKSGFIRHEKLPEQISRVSHIALTLEEFNVVDKSGLEEAIRANGGKLTNSFYHIMSAGTLESILEEDCRDLFEYCVDREEKGTTNLHFSDADVIRDKQGSSRDKKLMQEIIKNNGELITM